MADCQVALELVGQRIKWEEGGETKELREQ